MGRNFLGEFEQIVLLAMARVGEGAYAVSIHDEILQTTWHFLSHICNLNDDKNLEIHIQGKILLID